MINAFKMRKAAAIIMACCISCILFYVGFSYWDFFGGIGFMLLSIILNMLLGSMLLKNPFTDMLEGKGLLVLNLDSSGIIHPFTVEFKSPYIMGNLFKKQINDVFDRDTVLSISPGSKTKGKSISAPEMKAKNEKEGEKTGDEPYITIEIEKEKDFNDARFGLYHYPVLIYNQQLESLMTKDFLKKKEDSSFANHSILYANRKLQELSTDIKNFGRYVVENLKPKGNWLQSGWTWIIVVIIIIIMIILFAPSISKLIGTTASAVSKGAGGAIIPR